MAMRVLGSGVRVTVPPSWAAPGLLPRARVTGLPSGLATWTPSLGLRTLPMSVGSGWVTKLSWAGIQRSASVSTVSRARPFALGGREKPRRSRLQTLLRSCVLFIAVSPHFRDNGGSPSAGLMVGLEIGWLRHGVRWPPAQAHR